MNKLIAAMQEAVSHTEEGDQVVYIQDIIDIITKHLDGYVVVKEDKLNQLLNMQEDGEYYARCELANEIEDLIKAHQESSDEA